MQGFAVFVVACVAVAHAQSEVPVCPSEQEDNWGIEMLLRHDDCNKFYKCTFGHPVEYSCYDGLFFNLVSWQCDWKDNVDCTGRNIPNEESPSTPFAPVPPTFPTTTTTTTAEPTTAEPTTPEPTTTITTTNTTEPPTNITSTTTTTTTTEPPTNITSTTTTTTPAPEPETEAQPEEKEEEIIFQENGCPVDPHIHWLLPSEEDCNKFYYCVWGKKVQMECPAGLHFNTKLQVCDWPAAAGCTVGLNKHFYFRQMLRQLL